MNYVLAVFAGIICGATLVAYLKNRFLGVYLYFLLAALLRKEKDKIVPQLLKFWRLTKFIFISVFIYLVAVWILIPKIFSFGEYQARLFDVSIATSLLIVGWGELKLFFALYSIVKEVKKLNS